MNTVNGTAVFSTCNPFTLCPVLWCLHYLYLQSGWKMLHNSGDDWNNYPRFERLFFFLCISLLLTWTLLKGSDIPVYLVVYPRYTTTSLILCCYFQRLSREVTFAPSCIELPTAISFRSEFLFGKYEFCSAMFFMYSLCQYIIQSGSSQ